MQYQGIEQLKISVERLREENIYEHQEEYNGEFQGVLPQIRAFAFKIADEDGALKGKVDVGIEDPGILNREWLHKPVRVKLDVAQVGQGRPCFTLSN